MKRFKLSPEKYRLLKRDIAERDVYCRGNNCGRSDMLSPHHIISRAMGGGDFIENIIILCLDCHSQVEQNKTKIPDYELDRIGFYLLSYCTKTRTQTRGKNDLYITKL